MTVRRRRVDRHPGYPPGRRQTPRLLAAAALVAAGAGLVAGLVAAGRRIGRLEPVRVAGASMAPTLPDGTLVAVGPLPQPGRRRPRRARPGARTWAGSGPPPSSTAAGRPGQPASPGRPALPLRRGQLVLAGRPGDRGPAPLEVVKRVVGLPGELVRIDAAGLWVDGRRVAEPYLGGRPAGAPFELRLGAGEYLVLGDARSASTDGRSFGPIEAKNIAAIVRFVYWPPSVWRLTRVVEKLRASTVSSGRRAEMGRESAVDGRIRRR